MARPVKFIPVYECVVCEHVLQPENARLRQTIKDLIVAWSRSWDCSRDPGHAIMEEALGRAAEALDR